MGNNRYFAGQTVQITGNTLIDSGAVARILMHPNGDFAADLEVEYNHVGMTQHPYLLQGPRGPTGFAIEQYQVGNPPIGNITIQRNIFTAPVPTTLSPYAVSVNPTAGPGKLFHLKSLTVRDNTFVNFSQDGKELNITHEPAYNPHYTQAGNTFAPVK
jgi:hypothetical protein